MNLIPEVKLIPLAISCGSQAIIHIGLFLLHYFKVKPFVSIFGIMRLFIANIRSNYNEDSGIDGFLLAVFSMFVVSNLFNLLGFFPVFVIPQFTYGVLMIIFTIMIILAVYNKGWHIFANFVPSGIPVAIRPMLYILEVLSFLIKPLIFTVRLVFNIIVGHMLLYLIDSIVPARYMWLKYLLMSLCKIIELCTLTLQIYLLIHLLSHLYNSITVEH